MIQKRSNIQLENSFTLNFTNTTNSVRSVALFKEGLSGTSRFVVEQTNSADEIGANGNITQPAIIWNFVGNQPYQYEGVVTPVTAPININQFKATTTGVLEIISDNGGSKVDVSILNTDTLNDVNEKINSAIRLNADLTNFKSPSGLFAVVNVVFDINYFEQFPLPQPKNLTPYKSSWGISVQYPTDLPHKLLELNFPTNPNSEFATLNAMSEALTSSANGVVIGQGNNVSYQEILESQNGSVLDIDTLVVNVGKSPTIAEKQSQLLQPFKFAKRDVDGNEVDVVKTQLIDPYQDQYSYREVNMIDGGDDRFYLDGNTAFIYKIEPLTQVKLSYNYRRIKNSTFETEKGSEELKQESNNIKKVSEKNKWRSVKELDLNVKLKNKKNKIKPFYIVVGSVLAYFLLIQNKPK